MLEEMEGCLFYRAKGMGMTWNCLIAMESVLLFKCASALEGKSGMVNLFLTYFPILALYISTFEKKFLFILPLTTTELCQQILIASNMIS